MQRQHRRAALHQAGGGVASSNAENTVGSPNPSICCKRPPARLARSSVASQIAAKNPGALYVKTEADEYLGKILGTEYTGKPAPALAAIAADPRGEAIRYGQRTGTCSCCGRDLTAESSVAAGIGPICARKWGI